MRQFIICFLLSIFIIGCTVDNNKDTKNKTTKRNDCLQLESLDSSEYYRKPYIRIDSTIKSDSGCIYLASTYIFLDSIYTSQILLRKNDNQFLARTIQPESIEFVLFNLNQQLNKTEKVTIQYQDSLFQNFETLLEKKICLKNSDTAFVFRINDFYYYSHDGLEFTSSLDVVFFLTREKGIIGSYLTNETNDSTKIFISPGGNILKDYIDYSKFEEKVLQ